MKKVLDNNYFVIHCNFFKRKDIQMQAFPTTQYANGISPTGHAEGMTLRDYFAAKAMHVLYQTAYQYEFTGESRTPEYAKLMKELSLDAYGIADAMMEARNVAQ